LSERVHDLKVDPELWDAVVSGDKPFEVRKNDRHFQKGDVLELRVFDVKLPVNRQPEIPPAWRRVTFVLMGGQYGLESGYVALGVKEWPEGGLSSPSDAQMERERRGFSE
jgi:hypothetical protein